MAFLGDSDAAAFVSDFGQQVTKSFGTSPCNVTLDIREGDISGPDDPRATDSRLGKTIKAVGLTADWTGVQIDLSTCTINAVSYRVIDIRALGDSAVMSEILLQVVGS